MKIFGIGLSRTGTTSLTRALEILGYKSVHYPIDILHYDSSGLSVRVDQVQNYDALTDTPIARFYQQLDVAYPNSKFILTIRELESWLASCEKHLRPRITDRFSPSLQGSACLRVEMEMRDQLRLAMFNTTEFDSGKFVDAYHRHVDDVLSYFDNRPDDLLVLNVCAGEGWEKLCPFVEKPMLDTPFPKLNASTGRHTSFGSSRAANLARAPESTAHAIAVRNPRNNHQNSQEHTIAIAATFTAEPLEESLAFWMGELAVPCHIAFAPYNQVFQQLLDPASLLSQNQNGINVILVRLEDWERFTDATKALTDSPSDAAARIERNVRDFVCALQSAAQRSPTTHLVCLCPASSAAVADAKLTACFKQMEEVMESALADISTVYLVTPDEIAATYPVSAYHDPLGDALGHMPFTPTFFAALGTLICRKLSAVQRAPYKGIVLDCDGTLWQGVCGEDGPLGIAIDSPRKALQEFMVAQHDAGMLICLCSKNNEDDVVAVFAHHPEMPLRRDHIVSWRINWEPKSENIRSLAEELQLGLDSFIFIDDNPIECAEVRAHCPEVITLQLPQAPDHIPKFLQHVWALDLVKSTTVDRMRTALYQQHLTRERFRNESLSLNDFLTGLELKVQITAMAPQHLARVSQLTQRTNQLNVATIRRSEGEIQHLCQSGKLECLIVEVSDRFGDYGLVGVLMFQSSSSGTETPPDAINVDTFLLSCRAMGRGVEHQMLAKLGEIGKARGLSRVDATYIPTKRNQPALDFLEGVGAQYRQPWGDGLLFRFPVEFVAGLPRILAHPVPRPGIAEPTRSDNVPQPSSVAASIGAAATSALLSRIATELCDAAQVRKAIASQKHCARPDLGVPFVAPRTPIEKELADIWSELLSVDQVGLHDNFFELGGHSLSVIQVMSRVDKTFGVQLSLRSFFVQPTVERLVETIELSLLQQAHTDEFAQMLKALDGLSDDEVRALLASEGEVV